MRAAVAREFSGSVEKKYSPRRRHVFEGFEQQWTPVEIARRLRRGRVLRVRVAGEDVALVRDRRGVVGALIDRCPHRGAALSLGCVTEHGLECPFHGWTFAHDGACTRVPMTPLDDAKRARLSATALPTREVGGLIWVFTGTDARHTEPEPAPALIEPGWVAWHYVETWNAHWTRAMENMLDVPHLPYVHRRTIGRGLRKPALGDSELVCRAVPEPYGMSVEATLDGQPVVAGLEWRRPNGMVLHLTFGTRRVRQHVFCVPVDEAHTRMFIVSLRDFGRYNPLLRIFDRFNARILGEDRAVVESIRPLEVPAAQDEKSVASDAPTLYFRRYYHRELRGPRPDVAPEALTRKSA